MFRLFTFVALATSLAHADTVSAPLRAHAIRKTGDLTIDGHLDEAVWQSAPKQTGFVQRFPKGGAKATQDTTFAIVYDDDAIYVGVWAADADPALIRRLLTRRDVDALADAIVIGFDSYHDHRTAYAFQLNAAGVQRDLMLFDDASQDDTWDAVWTGDAAVDEHGWTAEFRIPLAQLRFATGDAQEWGFQIMRVVARSQEQTTWSPSPRSAPQVVSKFGVLDGLDHMVPGRRLELLPYVTGGVDVEPIEAGDPLNAHVSALRGVGFDLKYGLGPAFTLSATINPDFGQVEADPSQVNLGPNELFFAEKRPFFLEGIDLFKLPIGNSDNSREGPFYSRRIGATPAAPDMDYQYVRAPPSTTIYGAAKLTGKREGWSIGMLDAVTGEETATVVDATGARMQPLVAPLTNFAVARMKRDLNDGKTTLGLSATTMNRAVAGTPIAATMHDQAYTAGAQLQHRWGDNAWLASFSTVGSWVHGTPDALAVTQQSNRHLFQRPDATDVRFDPMRTSLGGLATTWQAGRLGDTKHWRIGTGGDLRTPGLELNDVGFQQEADLLVPYVWTQYRDDDPGKHVLNWDVNGDVFTISNFEPILENYGFEANASTQLASYWTLAANVNGVGGGKDPVALRGGPALLTDPNVRGVLAISTDSRKRVRLDLSGNVRRDWSADAIAGGIDATATIQARSNIDLTLGPSWFERDDQMQYVASPTDSAGQLHYIVARIHQTTTSLTVRMNWTFSPHLSLQLYAQPFIAAGRYGELKDVVNPHADRFRDRFYALAGSDYHVVDNTVYVSHAGSYRFDRPDFDLQQLRSTMVLRWEYRPGSTLFAIWSHGQTNQLVDGRFQLGRDLSDLARAASENIVMVKANYWIGL